MRRLVDQLVNARRLLYFFRQHAKVAQKRSGSRSHLVFVVAAPIQAVHQDQLGIQLEGTLAICLVESLKARADDLLEPGCIAGGEAPACGIGVQEIGVRSSALADRAPDRN